MLSTRAWAYCEHKKLVDRTRGCKVRLVAEGVHSSSGSLEAEPFEVEGMMAAESRLSGGRTGRTAGALPRMASRTLVGWTVLDAVDTTSLWCY